ncbi:MAG: electron transfer flavoprotein-ubiquinone oxidoreductase [Desulfobacteraceae bacterium]|nr:electron transfer flavoprotein-ubiquinone oxidoreductase [Desulfobacteraceae bacterium]
MTTEYETIEFDVLFVGGGPACLAGAIRLMQTAKEQKREIEVALIEKGAEIGSHAVSGAILNPRALKALIPDYLEKNFPLEADIRGDEFYFLTEKGHYKMPMVPRYLHNEGFHVVSQSKLCRWLGSIAEDMGVNIFPGFTGKKVLYADDGKSIIGVRTGDKGLGRDGEAKANFEPGYDILARVTVFGEGARGNLTKEIDAHLDLYDEQLPPVYETGIKEVIQLPEHNYFNTSQGNVVHVLGYPLGLNIPGGGFIYQMKDNKIAIGYLTGLCYEDPALDPYEEFIKFKHHPFIAGIIKGGKVVEQGARTVSTGGFYTFPRLTVNGAVFVGGGASIHNTPALKGIHVAMKSGLVAADTIQEALAGEELSQTLLDDYARRFRTSWAGEEIYEGRNFAAALARKVPTKFVHLGAQYVSKGRGIVERLGLEEDCLTLKPLKNADADMPDSKAGPYDGELYIDKLTGVYLSKTLHREDQPSHLLVHDTDLCVTTCYETYKSPCTRFCPGNVYEIETDGTTGQRKLKLNPSNCFHCKTCDIKDPYRNITWVCPEGGDGPGYNIV